MEETFINNYKLALSNKIFLENLISNSISIYPYHNNSLYLWNCYEYKFHIKNKCNHLFIYNCTDCTIHINNFVSGITLMYCKNCTIIFKNIPTFNIELSNSIGLNFVAISYSCNINHNNVIINFLKRLNYLME